MSVCSYKKCKKSGETHEACHSGQRIPNPTTPPFQAEVFRSPLDFKTLKRGEGRGGKGGTLRSAVSKKK